MIMLDPVLMLKVYIRPVSLDVQVIDPLSRKVPPNNVNFVHVFDSESIE